MYSKVLRLTDTCTYSGVDTHVWRHSIHAQVRYQPGFCPEEGAHRSAGLQWVLLGWTPPLPRASLHRAHLCIRGSRSSVGIGILMESMVNPQILLDSRIAVLKIALVSVHEHWYFPSPRSPSVSFFHVLKFSLQTVLFAGVWDLFGQQLQKKESIPSTGHFFC